MVKPLLDPLPDATGTGAAALELDDEPDDPEYEPLEPLEPLEPYEPEPEVLEPVLSESDDEPELEDWPGLRFSVACLASAVKDSMVRDLFAAGL